MNDKRNTNWRQKAVAAALLMFLAATSRLAADEPSAAAVAGFNSYTAAVEARLAEQHGSPDGYLAREDSAALRRGEPALENLASARNADLPGAMLHDWRGTAFVPGAKAEDFERVMKDFANYPRIYSPEVERAAIASRSGDTYKVTMRVRQQHVLTVVLDMAFDVNFGHSDFGPRGARCGYSISRSTQVAEIDSPGTPNERALSANEDHGFLWRINTYWSYEERDGGLYIQIESVSLTRAIPLGLAWMIGPFIESVPRESLEFTLRSTYTALRR